jgi:hypothetical protein
MRKHVGNRLPDKPVPDDQNRIESQIATGRRGDTVHEEYGNIDAYDDKGNVIVTVIERPFYYGVLHT